MTYKVAGSIRFNTDSAKMEIYNGEQWWEIDSTSPEKQTGGTRGLFAGGRTPSDSNQIQFINVDSTGNATDFGNLTAARKGIGGCSDRTRGVFGGGDPVTNVIDFVTIASTGDATNFGDLTEIRGHLAGGNNSTRGIFAGGTNTPANHNTIDYITIASTGDAVDFGDVTLQARQIDDTCESPTRCVLIAGIKTSPFVAYNYLEYITTSTTGNTTDFGDLTNGVRYGLGSLSNAIRGVIGGGDIYPAGRTNSIEFITIATLGNSIDFGDQTDTFHYGTATGSPTRGVFAGGNSPSKINSMCYIQIMTTGDAQDFGDLNQTIDTMTGCSNGNGGLG